MLVLFAVFSNVHFYTTLIPIIAVVNAIHTFFYLRKQSHFETKLADQRRSSEQIRHGII